MLVKSGNGCIDGDRGGMGYNLRTTTSPATSDPPNPPTPRLPTPPPTTNQTSTTSTPLPLPPPPIPTTRQPSPRRYAHRAHFHPRESVHCWPSSHRTICSLSMLRHSWEVEEPPLDPPNHSWEDVSECGSDVASVATRSSQSSLEHSAIGSVGSDPSEVDQNDAAEDFIDYCTSLLLMRDLNAKQFCIIMHFAGKLRDVDAAQCALLGLPPDAPSGHYQRKLNNHVGRASTSRSLYLVRTPCYQKSCLARSVREMPVLLPHELLARDTDACLRTRLREAREDNELPPCYFDHPVVRRFDAPDDPVLPLCLFMDGVPYSHVDSVIGVWVENYITGRRYLLAALRKRLLCKCGCRGWCSVFPIFQVLSWSFRCLADKLHPTSRHDGSPWAASDTVRLAAAGSPMDMRCCLLYIKGDWSEFATTFGLPSWHDGVRPCYLCNASGPGLFHYVGASSTRFPARENLEGEYELACERCEIWVMLSFETHKKILGDLHYDKRRQGSHGRCVGSDIPELGLVASDRLEPSAFLDDVGRFEEIRDFPTPVLFWRQQRDTLTRHRNPLFDQELGITVHRSLSIGTLHAVYLGVMQSFCKHVVWAFLLSGAWGGVGSQDEVIEIGLQIFGQYLSDWYSARKRSHPEEVLTHISDVTRKMVGDPSDRRLKTKGAETWGLLLFLSDELTSRWRALGEEGDRLREAAACLVTMCQTWDAHGANLGVRHSKYAGVRTCVS